MNPKTLLALLVAAPLFALPPLDRLPMRAAAEQANAWNAADGHTVFPAAFTGSMRPYIVGGELILCEKYTGQPIRINDLIVVHRWDKPAGVLHTVTDQSATRVKTQGENCTFPDGWQDKGRVRHIVRRVIRIQN